MVSATRPADGPWQGHAEAPIIGLSLVWQSIWGGRIGYSLHSEAMAEELAHQGVYLMHRPVDSPFAGPPLRPALRSIARRPIRDDVPQVSYAQADQFETRHRGPKIGFTMLEVDGIPEDWVRACNAMDELFVPSRFNEETFRESGVQCPITVVPLGLDPRQFNPSRPDFRLRDRCVFLSIFEWGHRKGPDVLLKTYAEEFSRDERTLLLLKVDNRDPAVDLRKEVDAMGLPENRAPIAFLYNQPIPDDQIASLYRSADCFVLPTRGEGWGMPILEAMACGLPVIATDWSAQTEFLNPTIAYPLAVERLTPAIAKCPYYTGFRWAEPSGEHLRQLMRHVYQNREEAALKGAKAAEEVARSWTWRFTAERIVQRLRAMN